MHASHRGVGKSKVKGIYSDFYTHVHHNIIGKIMLIMNKYNNFSTHEKDI